VSKATEAYDAIQAAIQKVKDFQEEQGRGIGGRETSLCLTNLEQGQLWFVKGIEVSTSPQKPE
jgi:hypothetical protein